MYKDNRKIEIDNKGECEMIALKKRLGYKRNFGRECRFVKGYGSSSKITNCK